MTKLVCSACGIEIEAGCECGAEYVLKKEKAAKAIVANPKMSTRAIAEQIGTSHVTVFRVRNHVNQVLPNVTPDTCIGRDNKQYPAHMPTRAPTQTNHDFVLMPNDIRERYDAAFDAIRIQIHNLLELGTYADQMHPALRNHYAKRLRTIRDHFRGMAKNMIGGDLRKIQEPPCTRPASEYPLRIEDEILE